MEFRRLRNSREMRARNIGADELDAIEICRGYVDAQRKYASEDRDKDGVLEYAPRLMSTPGQQDGLYWEGEGSLRSRRFRAGGMGRRGERAKPSLTTDIISGFSRGRAPMRRAERTITSSRTS